MFVAPEITPGVLGTLASTMTGIVALGLFPQLLLAYTEIVPLVELARVEIELVLDEPFHPDGSDHV